MRRLAPALAIGVAAVLALGLAVLRSVDLSSPEAPVARSSEPASLFAWRGSTGDRRFALRGGKYRARYLGAEWSFRSTGLGEGSLPLTVLMRWDP